MKLILPAVADQILLKNYIGWRKWGWALHLWTVTIKGQTAVFPNGVELCILALKGLRFQAVNKTFHAPSVNWEETEVFLKLSGLKNTANLWQFPEQVGQL